MPKRPTPDPDATGLIHAWLGVHMSAAREGDLLSRDAIATLRADVVDPEDDQEAAEAWRKFFFHHLTEDDVGIDGPFLGIKNDLLSLILDKVD